MKIIAGIILGFFAVIGMWRSLKWVGRQVEKFVDYWENDLEPINKR